MTGKHRFKVRKSVLLVNAFAMFDINPATIDWGNVSTEDARCVSFLHL
jgi:hypothetical protein